MRAALVVEPAVLAMPALSKDEDSIARSIETIIQLSQALRETDFRVCLLTESENYLAGAGLYPVFQTISQSLASCGLSHVYTTEDIRRSVQNILQRADRLESVSEIEFLIPESIQTTPDVLSSRTNGTLKEALETTLLHACLVTAEVGNSNARILMADRYENEDIEVEASITE